MLTLIKNAHVYSPEPLGQCDVLIAGTKIVAIEKDLMLETSVSVRHLDGTGCIITPGFVDSLVHICGGGGEDGFASRTPEMQLSDATLAGITTVVGALGTDAVARTHTNLVAKAKGLKEEGLNAFCYTGSYHFPAPTLSQSVEHDIMFIEEMIGVGEVAISDHRSSQPDAAQLASLASHARVAGMLSKKRAPVSIHVGPADTHLSLLHEVAEHFDVPLNRFYPTHMNRNKALLDAGIRFATAGGTIDFTTSTTEYDLAHGEYSAARALAYSLQAGVIASRLTMSSDGHASLPVFDEQNNLIGLEVGHESSLFTAFTEAVQQHDVPLEQALMAVTSNPADVLGLKKGRLAENADADLLLLDADSLALKHVFCNGQHMVSDGKPLVLGRFEKAAITVSD